VDYLHSKRASLPSLDFKVTENSQLPLKSEKRDLRPIKLATIEPQFGFKQRNISVPSLREEKARNSHRVSFSFRNHEYYGINSGERKVMSKFSYRRSKIN